MSKPLAGHTNSYHTYSHDEALQGIAEAGDEVGFADTETHRIISPS